MSDDTSATPLAGRIKAIRLTTGLSQELFASAINEWLREHDSDETVTQPVVSAWERGDFAPTPTKLRAIAAVGRSDAGDLLALRAGVTDDDKPSVDPLRGEFADLPDEDYDIIRAMAKRLREARGQ